MTTNKKQPTLKQLNLASTNLHKAYVNLDKVEAKYSPEATQKQFDTARLRVKNAHTKYWEMVDLITEDNPEYDTIIGNGHYEG